MSIVTFESELSQEEELVLTCRKKYNNRIPPFLPLGTKGMSKYKIEGIETSTILKDLSKSATWLFWTLENQRDKKTNIVNLVPKDDKDKHKILTGYKELNKLDWVKRIQRGKYLINPKVLLPLPFENYEPIQKQWDELS